MSSRYRLKWEMGKDVLSWIWRACIHRNFVGIEMDDSVLLRAVQKREQLEEDLPNLYFIRMDARNLPDVFEKGEVDKNLSEFFRIHGRRGVMQNAV